MLWVFFKKQFAATITYEEEWAFVEGGKKQFKMAKIDLKGSKGQRSPHTPQPRV